MGNTVISAYIVDAYPLQSMSVITFYAIFLNLSAFINPVCPPSYSLSIFLYLNEPLLIILLKTVLHRSLASLCGLDMDLHNARHHCAHFMYPYFCLVAGVRWVA